MEGMTRDGFKFTVDQEKLNDWELIEDIADAAEGAPEKLVFVLRRLLGPDQMKALKDHCRDPETGVVRTTDMMNAFIDIMGSDKSAKNS